MSARPSTAEEVGRSWNDGSMIAATVGGRWEITPREAIALAPVALAERRILAPLTDAAKLGFLRDPPHELPPINYEPTMDLGERMLAVTCALALMVLFVAGYAGALSG